MLLQACVSEEIVSLEQACEILGLNLDKILEYSITDQDALGILRLCVGMLKSHVHKKFYEGHLSKSNADQLILSLEDVELIYLNNISEGFFNE